MPRPLIFISHKHNDRKIASVVRGFISEQTRAKVPVFQSSDPAAITPHVGRTLNAELRQALWNAGAVILIYTTEDQDWGYCMWECGVAMLPDSPDSRVILLQCGDSAPSLFAGQTVVKARDRTSVATFVTQFMTEPDFLPRAGDALTGYHKESAEVTQAANRFFGDLQEVLPKGPVADWAPHPYLQVQVPYSSAASINEAPAELRPAQTRSVVLEQGVISDHDNATPALFGLAEFGQDMRLRELYDSWRAADANSPDLWFESLVEQVGRASVKQLPTLRWTVMASRNDGRPYVPVLTRVRNVPSLEAHQFDVYFYPFNLLDATPVQSQMRARKDMFCRVLGEGGEDKVTILDLIDELEERRFSRMPFVDAQDRLVYIAHRSMLDQFVSRRFRKQRDTAALPALTLADLFREEPPLKAMFTQTAAFVSSTATLADARAAMGTVPNCYDVFVTKAGGSQEPVIGWLTDVKIAASEV